MKDDTSVQLSFDEFWSWLLQHPNCILRAGTPEIMIHDHEDYHWMLWKDELEIRNVQLLRGKQPMVEFFIIPEAVDFVRGFPAEVEGEYIFELFALKEDEPFVSYFFIMIHGLDDLETGGRVH